VLAYKYLPRAVEMFGLSCSGAAQRPARFFLGLAGVSFVAYLPMIVTFGPIRWFTFGPLAIQSCWILLYPAFFFVGVGIGAWGIERGLLAVEGKLARRWYLWLCLAVTGFALQVLCFSRIMRFVGETAFEYHTVASAIFAFACCSTSLFMLAVFIRFATHRNRIMDSLCANAYGIYLSHYAFVTWIQYQLLPINLPAVPKAAIVFAAALLLSWCTVAAIRRIPIFDRVLTSGAHASIAGKMSQWQSSPVKPQH